MHLFKWEQAARAASLIAMLSVMAVASGCKTIETRVVYQDRLVYPDDDKLRNCDVEKPPAKEDYLRQEAELDKTMEKREGKLTTFAERQTNNLTNCNIRLANLRKEKAELKQKFEAKNRENAKE